MQNVTPEQLQQKMASGTKPEIIDVRDPWEFETCRIEGSINIPMSDIVSHQDRLDRHTEKVIICHHGMRSLQVALYLESVGFASVINLEGGIDSWARTIDLDMPVY